MNTYTKKYIGASGAGHLSGTFLPSFSVFLPLFLFSTLRNLEVFSMSEQNCVINFPTIQESL